MITVEIFAHASEGNLSFEYGDFSVTKIDPSNDEKVDGIDFQRLWDAILEIENEKFTLNEWHHILFKRHYEPDGSGDRSELSFDPMEISIYRPDEATPPLSQGAESPEETESVRQFMVKMFPTNDYMDCPIPTKYWRAIQEYGDQRIAHLQASLLKSQESHAAIREQADKMRHALNEIITLNEQQAIDQYGNADRAESWACVVIARKALKV